MAGEKDELKGRVKQAVGDLTDDDRMRREGKKDETAGKAKRTVESVKDAAEDAIDSVRDRARPDR